MQTKQRFVLLILVILSVIQQGVRWKLNTQVIDDRSSPVRISTVLAAETPPNDGVDEHCPLVHINSAGMAELQTLPGIGPIYAERIIIQRKEEPFKEKHDLLRVAGIGEKRLAQIGPLICLFPSESADAK